MSGFTELERIKIAAKALAAGVKDADPTTQWYESITANAFVLAGEKVWTSPDVDDLRANPITTAAEGRTLSSGTLFGIIEDYSLPENAVELTAVPGINNTYVALNTPGDFSSGRLENWVLPQFVPRSNGLPSTGYGVRLYDGDPDGGGTEVFTTDGATGTGVNKTVAWIFDYATGILLLSDTSSLFGDDPYINGFVYTGTTANDGGSGGGSVTISGGGFIQFDANCPSATAVDDFVYVTGPTVSNLLQVDTVNVTDIGTMPAFGIVVEKASPTECTVRVSGEVIVGAVLTPGKRYFIDSSGQPSALMPTPPTGGKAAAQAAGYALDTDRLLLTLDQVPFVRVG